MCLSLGFDHDPPVPIDGKVIRGRVWPLFIRAVPASERPADWTGDTFEAYGRYMTAILTWADQRGWSTPDVERTICVEVEPDWERTAASHARRTHGWRSIESTDDAPILFFGEGSTGLRLNASL